MKLEPITENEVKAFEILQMPVVYETVEKLLPLIGFEGNNRPVAVYNRNEQVVSVDGISITVDVQERKSIGKIKQVPGFSVWAEVATPGYRDLEPPGSEPVELGQSQSVFGAVEILLQKVFECRLSHKLEQLGIDDLVKELGIR